MVEWPKNPLLAGFEYERGEGRHKHTWNRDEAGFVPSKRGAVGKCHSSITEELAEHLLRSGIIEPDPFSLDEEGEDEGGDKHPAPREIYNIYKGVPYVAVPTRPGFSYHGFPWRGRMSATVLEAMRRRAEEEGTLKVFDRWLKQYGE